MRWETKSKFGRSMAAGLGQVPVMGLATSLKIVRSGRPIKNEWRLRAASTADARAVTHGRAASRDRDDDPAGRSGDNARSVSGSQRHWRLWMPRLTTALMLGPRTTCSTR